MVTELVEKFLQNWKKQDFIDGIIFATSVFLLLLSSSYLVGNQFTIATPSFSYSGTFDFKAENYNNPFGVYKDSDGEEKTMYFLSIEEFDGQCITKLHIKKHDGKTYSGTYCLNDNNVIDTLEKYNVEIISINKGLEKPIKLKITRKIVVPWYLILMVAILLLILLRHRLRGKKKGVSRR